MSGQSPSAHRHARRALLDQIDMCHKFSHQSLSVVERHFLKVPLLEAAVLDLVTPEPWLSIRRGSVPEKDDDTLVAVRMSPVFKKKCSKNGK